MKFYVIIYNHGDIDHSSIYSYTQIIHISSVSNTIVQISIVCSHCLDDFFHKKNIGVWDTLQLQYMCANVWKTKVVLGYIYITSDSHEPTNFWQTSQNCISREFVLFDFSLACGLSFTELGLMASDIWCRLCL